MKKQVKQNLEKVSVLQLVSNIQPQNRCLTVSSFTSFYLRECRRILLQRTVKGPHLIKQNENIS